jgi:hypothetical protein
MSTVDVAEQSYMPEEYEIDVDDLHDLAYTADSLVVPSENQMPSEIEAEYDAFEEFNVGEKLPEQAAGQAHPAQSELIGEGLKELHTPEKDASSVWAFSKFRRSYLDNESAYKNSEEMLCIWYDELRFSRFCKICKILLDIG